jgi:hypothetical protein
MFHSGTRLYTIVVKRFLLVTTLVLAGCSGDMNPVRDALVSTGVTPQATPAPDFVVESRPASIDYQPVGSAAPARTTPAPKPDQVKAVEAELDAVRARNEAEAAALRRAGSTPAPTPAQAR